MLNDVEFCESLLLVLSRWLIRPIGRLYEAFLQLLSIIQHDHCRRDDHDNRRYHDHDNRRRDDRDHCRIKDKRQRVKLTKSQREGGEYALGLVSCEFFGILWIS